MNPNLTRPQPSLPESWNRDNWTKKDCEMYEDYEKWQEENSGVYFRNNVWGWRPLWHFVTISCESILTEKDILVVSAGTRYLKLKFSELKHYCGERGRRGNKLPRGFQKVDSMEIEVR